MDWLSWLMVFAVVFITCGYTHGMLKLIYGYKAAVQRGELQDCDGVISAKTEEKNKRFGGKVLNTCYPVYKTMISGQEKILQSVLEHHNVSIGQPVALCYDPSTGDLWCKDDMPGMKKRIAFWLVTMVLLLIVVVATNILL